MSPQWADGWCRRRQSNVAVVALLTHLLPGSRALQEAFNATRTRPPSRLAAATATLGGRAIEGPLPSRVAFAFYGQYHWDQETPSNCVDYFLSVNNIVQQMIEPLASRGIHGGTYFHTWKAQGCPDKDEALVEKLSPVRYHFEEAQQAKPSHPANSALKALKLVQETEWPSEKTVVVLLRFNVQYSVPINELDIKWEAVNLAFRESSKNWERCHMASDLFHIFPIGKINAVAAALGQSAQTSSQHCFDSTGTGHYVYEPLKEQLGEAMLHFISPGFHNSSEQVIRKSRGAESGMAPTSTFLGMQLQCRQQQHRCSSKTVLEYNCGVGAKSQEAHTDAPRRVVIGFHGEYHRTSDSAQQEGDSKCSDFFLSEQNIRSNIIDPLGEDGAEVAVYFHTVMAAGCADKDQALVDALKPKEYTFDKARLPFISDSYMKVMKLIADNEPPSNRTAVILLRFDVQYRVPVLNMNIKWEAMNFAFRDMSDKWERCHMASDLFLVFPLRMMPEVKYALEWSAKTRKVDPECFSDNGSGHFMYDALLGKLGEAKLNFVSPGCASSDLPPISEVTTDDSAFLGIERSCRKQGDLCSTGRTL